MRRQRKSSIPSVIDEESRLIPDTAEPPPVLQNIVVVDHDKMKERLNEIVRSKEGKMVNVNSQLPFNLHNRVLSNLDPSSSRSASLSTSPSHTKQNGRAPPTTSHPSNAHRPSHHHLHTHLVYSTPVHSKPPSPARHPSPTSSRPPSPSPAHPAEGEQAEDMEVFTRNPILNVRLVKGVVATDPTLGVFATRGRTRGRVNDLGEAVSPSPSAGRELEAGDANGGPMHDGSLFVRAPPPHLPEFKIQDIGSISRSWGD